MLVAPLGVAGRELVIVPTGGLHALAWSVLPSLAGRTFAVAPSAAAWMRAAAIANRPGHDVVIAGPGLRAAESEVADLAAGRPGTRHLVEPTAEEALAALDGARLAHVAAHGEFRADNPLFSCLHLADGPLTAYDLQRLRWPPLVLVLSSCESGLTGVAAGDELLGLAAVLLCVRHRAVIASTALCPTTRPRLMLRLHAALATAPHRPPRWRGRTRHLCLHRGRLSYGVRGAMDPSGLVRAAAGGDQGAWDALVARYVGLVWATARSYRLDDADASDVVQTTWLRLVEHLDRLRDPAAVGSWLATTARNEALRVIRVRSREVVTDELDEPSDEAPLDRGLLDTERDGAVRLAFAQLRERCQGLLRLLSMDEPPSYEEIAAALDMPIGAIGPTRARCLEQLRRHLESAQQVVEP